VSGRPVAAVEDYSYQHRPGSTIPMIVLPFSTLRVASGAAKVFCFLLTLN